MSERGALNILMKRECVERSRTMYKLREFVKGFRSDPLPIRVSEARVWRKG